MMNELTLRTEYEARTLDLLQELEKYYRTQEDPCCNGTVHFLKSGVLVLGLFGYEDEYMYLMTTSALPKGWSGMYESDSLWEVYLPNLTDPPSTESLLREGIEYAIAAFLGHESLQYQQERVLRRNIKRAARWCASLTKRMPEHLQPFAHGVLELYRNGNVALTFEPSPEASDSMKREFSFNCNSEPIVFGRCGDEFMCKINIGSTKGGPDMTWGQVYNLINKASA